MEQLKEYRDHGYTVLRGMFTAAECDAMVAHHMAWHAGEITIDGTEQRHDGDWSRTLNLHYFDPETMRWLLDPRLRQPLADCMGDEPLGVQTMYFFEGSVQGRHQDQWYLPGCMSAWIALIDVDQHNGTIWVQKGSHRGELIMARNMDHPHGQDLSNGVAYNAAVDALFERNATQLNFDEVPVSAKKGDVVLFHGVLIHRGGPIGQPGSRRHVLACHYLPKSFEAWPYGAWARYSFNGERFATTSETTRHHNPEVTNWDAIKCQEPMR